MALLGRITQGSAVVEQPRRVQGVPLTVILRGEDCQTRPAASPRIRIRLFGGRRWGYNGTAEKPSAEHMPPSSPLGATTVAG